jgi:Trypsin-co-occurring domain 1
LKEFSMADEQTQWQKIKLAGEDSRQIYLEVNVFSEGREEVGILDSIPFEQITETLSDIAQNIGNTLEKAKPSKATVELGVEFAVKNGALVAVIAQGSGKANLKISLEWKRSESKAASSD